MLAILHSTVCQIRIKVSQIITKNSPEKGYFILIKRGAFILIQPWLILLITTSTVKEEEIVMVLLAI